MFLVVRMLVLEVIGLFRVETLFWNTLYERHQRRALKCHTLLAPYHTLVCYLHETVCTCEQIVRKIVRIVYMFQATAYSVIWH